MQNDYIFNFKHFDPLTGELPEPHAILFTELIYRARKLLEKFSAPEIEEAIHALNEIPKDPAFIDPWQEERKREPILTPMYGTVIGVIPVSNDIEAIFKNIGNIELARYVPLHGFGWAQLFAAWTLFYPELIAAGEQSLKNWPANLQSISKPTAERISQIVQEYLQEATQTITFAELLSEQEALQANLLSARNRNAAKQRTSRTSAPLKDRVLNLYAEKYHSRSNRDASSKIYNELLMLEEIHFNGATNQVLFRNQLALQTDDPQKRFEVWIGQHKKKL